MVRELCDYGKDGIIFKRNFQFMLFMVLLLCCLILNNGYKSDKTQ